MTREVLLVVHIPRVNNLTIVRVLSHTIGTHHFAVHVRIVDVLARVAEVDLRGSLQVGLRNVDLCAGTEGRKSC